MDFPLILVLLTFAGLVVWAFDLLTGAPKRKAVIADLKQRLPAWEQAGSEDSRRFELAVESEAKEPLPVEYARSFLPVLIVVLVLRSFLVEPFQIPSSSMVPTLEVGDFILVNKFIYGIRLPVVRTKVIDVSEPQRGDVMVFFPPDDPRYFIKRVIGLPGDEIRYKNKTLYINDEPVHKELLAELPVGRKEYRLYEEQMDGVKHTIKVNLHDRAMQRGIVGDINDFAIEVEPGHYFMMGDNRDNSSDSRVWGMVPEQNIVGKAFAVWMHWDDFWSLPSFSTVGIIE
jgi:signal peptidase I